MGKVGIDARGDVGEVFEVGERIVGVVRRLEWQRKGSAGVGGLVEAAAAAEVIVARPSSRVTVGVERSATQHCEVAGSQD